MYNTYLLTCKVNGKVYVGYETQGEGSRWKEHIKNAFRYNSQYHLHRAMRKYGLENFIRKTLSYHRMLSCLIKAEIKFIKLYHASDQRYGYNQTEGGEGVQGLHHSKEAKEKIGKAFRGITLLEETKAKISEVQKKRWAKLVGNERKLSRKTRKKISQALKGKKGKKQSEETKKKASEALKRWWAKQIVRTFSAKRRRNISNGNKRWWSSKTKKEIEIIKENMSKGNEIRWKKFWENRECDD